jgi:hypothetical protein
MCTTTTSFPGYCAPKATTCTVDSDCPASWTCVDTRVVAGNAGAPAGSSGASIAPGEPAPTRGSTSTPPTPKICQSPYQIYGGAKDAEGRPVETIGGGTAGNGGNNGGGTGSTDQTSGVPHIEPSTSPGQSAAASGSGGCAVGGARGSALASALALLGLVAARRRRR